MTIDPIRLMITNQMVIINMLREASGLSKAAMDTSAKALNFTEQTLKEMDKPVPAGHPNISWLLRSE